MNREEAAKKLEFIVDTYGSMYFSLWGDEKEEVLKIINMYVLGPQPDPITGLVPCGCGGVAEQTDFHDGFFPYSKVECLECGNEIMRAGNTASEAHSEAKRAWNTSHGYTAPPRPSAIVPDAGEMAPNGDEGVTE